MRVDKKKIRIAEVITGLLTDSPVGRLGTTSADGYPMVKPLNFVYKGGKIYFHSAKEGEKMEDIARNNRVCFEIDFPIGFVKSTGTPCKADYLYQSVIIRGTAIVVDREDERIFALRGLMEKYQPDGGYGEFSEEKLAMTAVVRIDIEEMTGKQDLGKEAERKTLADLLVRNPWKSAVLQRS